MSILNRDKGSTLIEVVVATSLLVIMSGSIALALSTVFDSYTKTQSASEVEQNAGLIMSRLYYATETHNDSVILSHSGKSDFESGGAVFENTALLQDAEVRLSLENTALFGQYTSGVLEMEGKTKVKKVIVVGNIATPSASVRLKVAQYDKTNGTCLDNYEEFYGPNLDGSSSFSEVINEMPESASGGYLNPSECLKYKLFLERTSVTERSPLVFGVRVEK